MEIANVKNWGEETQRVKELFRELGCDLVGVAPVEPFPELQRFEAWLDRGFAGEMAYLHRHLEKSLDPRKILSSVQSVLVCGQVYETDVPHATEVNETTRGWISRYAWGDDYHDVLLSILDRGAERLKDRFHGLEYRAYVDTGPTRDRVWAYQAGLGWFGKNSCLINQNLGSYFFIGEIFLNLPLLPDRPVADRCGTCTRCVESCPTGAIVEPGVVDARKCISYLTIELKSAIPEDVREGIGNHIFGCDICQNVCPWNSKAPAGVETAYRPREGFFNPDLEEFYHLVRDEFPARFRKSPLKRSKQRGLLRNVAVAMGNSGQARFEKSLNEMAQHEDPLIREHARWALRKINFGKRKVKSEKI